MNSRVRRKHNRGSKKPKVKSKSKCPHNINQLTLYFYFAGFFPVYWIVLVKDDDDDDYDVVGSGGRYHQQQHR